MRTRLLSADERVMHKLYSSPVMQSAPMQIAIVAVFFGNLVMADAGGALKPYEMQALSAYVAGDAWAEPPAYYPRARAVHLIPDSLEALLHIDHIEQPVLLGAPVIVVSVTPAERNALRTLRAPAIIVSADSSAASPPSHPDRASL
jgi:hypothetical protein